MLSESTWADKSVYDDFAVCICLHYRLHFISRSFHSFSFSLPRLLVFCSASSQTLLSHFENRTMSKTQNTISHQRVFQTHTRLTAPASSPPSSQAQQPNPAVQAVSPPLLQELFLLPPASQERLLRSVLKAVRERRSVVKEVRERREVGKVVRERRASVSFRLLEVSVLVLVRGVSLSF